jgi:hypothetical protein
MDTIKSTKSWEGITHRPFLGEQWKCLEQQTQSKYSGTSFVRWGKAHHNGDPVSFWIIFNEFNMNYWTNKNLGYTYTVRGSVNTKPTTGLKYFHTLKEATDFMVYLAESTDKWIESVNSEETIKAYDKKLAEISKSLDRRGL